MKIIAVIPARLEASRFPRKLLQELGDAPVVVQTLRAAKRTELFDEVWVATDSEEIAKTVEAAGAMVFRSQQEHSCGSDRIAEVVAEMDVDLIINVQGDEPFIQRESLAALIDVFQKDQQQSIDMASLMIPLKNEDEIHNPNVVKVIVDRASNALYFSRTPLPYVRNPKVPTTHYRHIGIYAYRKQTLLDFAQHPQTPLEAAEQIECIRHLEYGKKIRMVVTDKPTVGIDTPEDLVWAQKLWNQSSV